MVDETAGLLESRDDRVRPDWAPGESIISTDRVRWAVSMFSPFKSPGTDGIYPVLLQKSLDMIIDRVVTIFKACLAWGYVPKSWRTVRAVFIPKPGRPAYDQAKSFRTISLTSFLLKTLERLIDRYIRDGALRTSPLHRNQHAYLPGKSTETALHSLVGRIEGALGRKEFALAAFLDIEGAFDNARFKAIEQALKEKHVPNAIVRWIVEMLETRKVEATLGGHTVRIKVKQGCPQGGVLSPLLWCILVDSLLRRLNGRDYYCQFYSDDGVIVIIGIDLGTVCDVMQAAFRNLERWCTEMKLSVAPHKLELVLFTRRKNLQGWRAPKLFGTTLEKVPQAKVLGVILDSKLTWKDHLEAKCQRAVVALWQARRAVGKSWGLNPAIMAWLYKMVIRPMLTYAALVWWERTLLKCGQDRLRRIQRMACLAISGAMRTTPTAAMELMLDLVPLDLYVQGLAMTSAHRLMTTGNWRCRRGVNGHSGIRELIMHQIPTLELPCDLTSAIYRFDQRYQILIPSREEWQNQEGLWREEEIVCFTDGSRVKKQQLSGAGVFSSDLGIEESFRLGRFATVPQAEVFAILMCCRNQKMQELEGKRVSICSDSRSALGALKAHKVRSKLAGECQMALNEVGQRNSVRILWVPGHMGIQGNEEADQLAKEGSSVRLVGPEPAIGLATSTVRESIADWMRKSQEKQWKMVTGCRQAKLSLIGTNCPFAKRAISLPRVKLKALVEFVTGHCRLRKHMSNIGIEEDPTCELCQGGEETPEHFLWSCDALDLQRITWFGPGTVEARTLLDRPLRELLGFIKSTRRFSP